jgi:hypothetical protein
MDQDLIDRIAKLIHPYLKTKHKEKESHDIAIRIVEELEKQPPTWYTHG